MRPMPDFERMVDQWGRPLAWRGKWVFENRYGGVHVDETVVLPAVFPRRYYKEPVLPHAR